MITLEQIRAAFPNGQMVGGKWVTRCILPGHEDKNPSLKITVDHDKVLCVCTCNRQSELYAAVMNRLRNDAPAPAPSVPKETGWSYSEEKVTAAAKRIGEATDFLNGRGISLAVARKHQLGFESIGGKEYLLIPTFFENALVAVKCRALHPLTRADKWKKWKRDEKVFYLYNREAIETGADLWETVLVVESELDALTAESHGIRAVSVDSAQHKLNERDIILIRGKQPDLIFGPDNDAPGLASALSIAAELGISDTKSLKWPQKDLGELYAANPAGFREAIAKLIENTCPLWRQRLKEGRELGVGEPVQPIKHILIEGVNFLGSLSGVGKTWLALSMAKALTTGDHFLGKPDWQVPHKRNVIYLVPEMGERAFRQRMEKMRLPMDGGIYIQTVADGALDLRSPLLLQAIRDLKPVLFLDTAIRFSTAESENDSAENATSLSKQLFDLRNAGVDCIVCLHHSPKASSENHIMTLENVLRGTGEFGACADVVWGIQRAQKRKGKNNQWDDDYLQESKNLTRLYVECVKPRDLPAADPFVIQGRPHIDEKGDFALIATDAQVGETMDADTVSEVAEDKAEKLAREKPDISKSQLAQETGISRNRIEEVLASRGLKYAKQGHHEGRWERAAMAPVSESGGEDDVNF